ERVRGDTGPDAVRRRRSRRPVLDVEEGRRDGPRRRSGSSGGNTRQARIKRLDVMASTGLFDDGKKGSRRPAAPYLRSCSASGGRRVSATQRSPAFCRHYPKRQIGLACLPSGDIDAAVCEIHRVSKLGLRGVELSNSWDMELMWPPCCE